MLWRVIFTFGVLVLSSVSCYDGWDPVAEKSAPIGEIPTSQNTKPIYYLQFTPIYLSNEAVADPLCFGATGTEDFRIAERSERITALLTALSAVSQTLEIRSLPITTTDCSLLAAIDTAAGTLDKSILGFPDDPLDRPMVHLKAVFWDGDISGTPTSDVTIRNWATWRTLSTRGRRAKSYFYLSQSNKTPGYFNIWNDAFPTIARSKGTPIDTIDPTDTGKAARQALALSDAETLTLWLLNTLTVEQ